ncbi:MAG: type II toxin-antitoxin system HipA family toxin [Thermoanaerobaculia bacterium]|nr:type II toxin-antitoxin system HipA family toxin [Thermoanaerobaculia bacterium]
MSRRLEVRLHELPVGQLAEMPDGTVEFRFSQAYREIVPRPVLGQKLEDDLAKSYRSRKGEKLPDFFANLVPEGHLRDVLEQAADLEREDDLAFLAFVGGDLPGAVTVHLVADEAPGRFVAEPSSTREEGQTEEGLRFSLAGVQLKFSMLREGDKLTLPASSRGGEWVVKFDSAVYSRLPENEFSMLEWARGAGFDVPECHLQDLDAVEDPPRRYAPPGKVLVIRRYDRSPGGRIHQEDFAQAVGLPPREKYGQVQYEVMARLARRFIDENAVDELIRRLVFVIASGNNDAHLKNWSLVYPDRIHARWAPLYDQVATVAWPEPDRALALKLAGVKEFHRIDRQAFERFAQKAHLEPRRVFDVVGETLERLRSVWPDLKPGLPLPPAHVQALREHWRAVPILRESGALD